MATQSGVGPAGELSGSDIDLRYLRYFIAVAEELNFTRAAERLRTVQPSLSQQIRRLEEIVGTPLLYRDKHRVTLTEAGRVFLQESRAMLQQAERAVAHARQAARAEAGQITIGFLVGTEGKIFPHILPLLHTSYPRVQVLLRSLTSPEQMKALQERDINVAFMRGPVDDPEIASEVVIRDAVLAILPVGHPLAKLQRVPVEKLASLPLIQVTPQAAPAIHHLINGVAARAGVHFHQVLETDSVLANVNAVGSGLGFSLAPEYIQPILPKTVVARPLDLNPAPEIDLLIAYRKDDKLPALALFLRLLRDCLPPLEPVPVQQ